MHDPNATPEGRHEALADRILNLIVEGFDPGAALESALLEPGTSITDVIGAYVVIERQKREATDGPTGRKSEPRTSDDNPAIEACIRMTKALTTNPGVQKELAMGEVGPLLNVHEKFLNMSSVILAHPVIPAQWSLGKSHLDSAVLPMAASRFVLAIADTIAQGWEQGSRGAPPLDLIIESIGLVAHHLDMDGEYDQVEQQAWVAQQAPFLLGFLNWFGGSSRHRVHLGRG